jgi:DNA polymerase III epsilon subunit-like protein
MYLILDAETTGLPRKWNAPASDLGNWPRAVQIAWVRYDEADRHVESTSCLVRPDGFTVPLDAQRVHGISTDRALKEGKPLQDVLGELSAAVEKAQTIIAHNMKFDGSVLAAEYLRLGLTPPFHHKRLVCTMVDSTAFCRLPGPYGYKWPTLPELHRVLFQSEYLETHEAGADAAACAKCFFELKRRGVVAVR